MQVSNNNVIRVSKGRGAAKPQKVTAIGGERRIDLVVGGKVTTSLAKWREEQTENNNRVEKVEEEEGDCRDQEGPQNEEVEVDGGMVEDLKEEKRREQYRRIQEFKRKKNEEKSILKKRRLEEVKLGGKVESFDIVKEVYRDQRRMDQGEIGLERRGEASQLELSLGKHNEKIRASMGKVENALVKTGIQEGLQIRTDLEKTTNDKMSNSIKRSQAQDKSTSLSLAATLAGLEDLLAEDTNYVDSLPDSREEIFKRVFKDSARLPEAVRPTTPAQTCTSNRATDLLQAAMSETFTSVDDMADAGVASVKQEKLASPNRKTSLCNRGNDYSIKQEIMDGVDHNIKKEPLDPIMTSSNDLASFFSDFGVAVVKTEPVAPPEELEDDGEVLFLSSNCHESGVEMVTKCSICLLTFQDAQALSKHAGQHSTVAPLASSLKSRVTASHLPTLSLTRVPLPASFKRKMQYALDEGQAPKVAKVEKASSTSLNLISGVSGIQEPKHNRSSDNKNVRDISEGVSQKKAESNQATVLSKGDGKTLSSQLRGEHSNMTTLQALDSLLGGGPASEPEVTCPVCGKQGYAS